MSSGLKDPKKKKSIGFSYAWNGIVFVYRNERNFRIHLLAGGLAVLAGLLLNIHTIEWAVIFTIILLVLTLELINSSIELVIDYLAPAHHPLAGLIKDMAAGAVLVASLGSLIIAAFIFLPHLIQLF